MSFFTNKITDGIYSVGNSVGKMLTLFTMLITDEITNEKFHRYFLENSGTVHSPIALLIIVFKDKSTDGLKSCRCYLAGF